MGEGLGYEDWDKIVKLKEASLESIETTRKNLECGEMVEKAALGVAIIERRKYRKYPEPATKTMEDTETPAEAPEEDAETEEEP